MAAPLAPVEVLERSRRGEPVDARSVEALARSWLAGDSSDALMAALCMAACAHELGPDQVEAIARALIGSGDRLELGVLGPVGDLATSGGVGDTVPLVAAPLAAALGVVVATTVERGISHTGGSLDKVEAIPGYAYELPLGRFVRQARDVGIVVAAAPDRLAPGVRRLAALRDATGTAVAPGLVAATMAAARLAGGAGALALQLDAGEGGLIGDADQAGRVGALLADMGARWGRRVSWSVVDASAPLGRAVGNALEVAEAGAVLRGEGPGDVRDLAVDMAGRLAEAAGVVPEGEGPARAAAALRDGAALAAAERWVEAQGADPAVWSDPGALPVAPLRVDVEAPRDGRVRRVAARGIGEAARWLGAGRLHAVQRIDPVAGVEVLVTAGERVEEGRPLAVVHARDDSAAARARDMVEAAFVIVDEGSADASGDGGRA